MMDELEKWNWDTHDMSKAVEPQGRLGYYCSDEVDALRIEEKKAFRELEELYSACRRRGTEAERNLSDCANECTNMGRIAAKKERLLKTAMDALKRAEESLDHVLHDVMDKEPLRETYDVVKKALADIEGETRAGFKVTTPEPKDYGDYPPDYGEQQIHGEPDWAWLKRNDAHFPGTFGGIPTICQAILWLRDKLSKLENTIEDMQAEMIKAK